MEIGIPFMLIHSSLGPDHLRISEDKFFNIIMIARQSL